MRARRSSSKQWMLWLAFVVAAAGGGIGYLLSINPETGTQNAYLAWSIAGAIVGILFISYTSDHWIHR